MSGEVLRCVRERHGVSVGDAARRAGLRPDDLVRIEQGEDRATADVVRALLAALGGPDAVGDLDDPGLIARQRAMSVGQRLTSGMRLSRFAASLAGSARG